MVREVARFRGAYLVEDAGIFGVVFLGYPVGKLHHADIQQQRLVRRRFSDDQYRFLGLYDLIDGATPCGEGCCQYRE